jgi:hypothetical protein
VGILEKVAIGYTIYPNPYVVGYKFAKHYVAG